MNTPKAIIDAIAALRTERLPLASRLDAIDLAIDNLQRVYGIHGEQPVLVERRKEPRTPRADREVTPRSAEAQERREIVLAIIGKAPHGMTAKELRKATPKIEDKDRSNALTGLRVKGQIKRVGNAWIKAA